MPVNNKRQSATTPSRRNSKSTKTYACTGCSKKITTSFEAALHPLIDCLICRSCKTTYGNGDFSLFEDGVDELGDDNFCRWCCDGGDLYGCGKADELENQENESGTSDRCHYSFCRDCIQRNVPDDPVLSVTDSDFKWTCYACDKKRLKPLIEEAKEAIEDLRSKTKSNSSKKQKTEHGKLNLPGPEPKTSKVGPEESVLKTAKVSSKSVPPKPAPEQKDMSTIPEPDKLAKFAKPGPKSSKIDLLKPASAHKSDSAKPAGASKFDSPKPSSASKSDSPKPANGPKFCFLIPAGASKFDSPKPASVSEPDSTKQADASKSDLSPASGSKPDIPKPTDTHKPDLPKSAEAPKSDLLKQADASKPETPKPADVSKPDLPKPVDAPKPESPKPAESSKPDLPKPASAPKFDILKPSSGSKFDSPKPPAASEAKIVEKKRPNLYGSSSLARQRLSVASVILDNTVRMRPTNDADLEQRLDFMLKTKGFAIEELDSKFRLIVELFKLTNKDNSQLPVLHTEIESIRKPIRDIENMVNELKKLSSAMQ